MAPPAPPASAHAFLKTSDPAANAIVAGRTNGEFAQLADDDLAPDYSAAWLDGTGELALSDLRDEVVLLNGWATWCEPCRDEMPFLERLHRDYTDRGLRVVGVSVDAGGADEQVRAFVDEIGATFTILRDPENRFADAFRTRGCRKHC